MLDQCGEVPCLFRSLLQDKSVHVLFRGTSDIKYYIYHPTTVLYQCGEVLYLFSLLQDKSVIFLVRGTSNIKYYVYQPTIVLDQCGEVFYSVL